METKGKLRSRNVPIEIIKQKVSIASRISVEDMELPAFHPTARKREKVNARNVSMALAKDFSGLSLAIIGRCHGDRDHATVLHAYKTTNNLLDTNDLDVSEIYAKSSKLIDEWLILNKPLYKHKMSKKEKNSLVKTWIRNRVPLYVRQRILLTAGKKCSVCGAQLINPNNYGNRTKTLSISLQTGYKK